MSGAGKERTDGVTTESEAMGERRDGRGPTEAECAEGERLISDAIIDERWFVLWDSDRDEFGGTTNEYPVGITPFPEMLSDDWVQGLERAELICWLVNHAGQLLADSRDLARERRRVAALERAIEGHIKCGHDQADELVAALLAADAPGQGGEGEGQ